MTLHDQQQAAADVQGMIEAAQRHSGGMSQVEVAEQYRAIQARPIASPVIPQPIPAEARPLSEFERNTIDRYFFGRDYPNFKATSNIPL
jgi:hypothetical protein